MRILPIDASDNEWKEIAREWTEFVAAGRDQDALWLLADSNWTMERIRAAVAGIKPPCPGTDSPHITSPKAAATINDYGDPLLDAPAHLVVRWIPSPATTGRYPGRVGEVHYELPINGYWSPVAVVFFIRKVQGGLALELRELLTEV